GARPRKDLLPRRDAIEPRPRLTVLGRRQDGRLMQGLSYWWIEWNIVRHEEVSLWLAVDEGLHVMAVVHTPLHIRSIRGNLDPEVGVIRLRYRNLCQTRRRGQPPDEDRPGPRRVYPLRAAWAGAPAGYGMLAGWAPSSGSAFRRASQRWGSSSFNRRAGHLRSSLVMTSMRYSRVGIPRLRQVCTMV